MAELAGRVVGYIGTGPSRDEDLGPTPEVYAVYLDPDAIGMGVGRTLFGHALDDLRRRGHRVAYLWVLAGNARARRFYEAAGGRPDGAQKTTCWPEVTFDEVRYGIDFG